MLKYKMYGNEELIGYFEVENEVFTATILKHHPAFVCLGGEINARDMADWVYERIVPPTRQNIEVLLAKMGLRDYDQLDILKYTKGKSVNDDLWIDFLEPVE